MTGRNLNVVQQPVISVLVEPVEVQRVKRKKRLALLSSKQQLVFNSSMNTVSFIYMSFSLSQCLFIAVLLKDVPPLFVPLYLIVSKVSERCLLMSPTQMNCLTPAVASQVRVKDVWFQLDNVRVRFESIKVLAMSFAFDILNISFPFSFYKYVSPFSFPL